MLESFTSLPFERSAKFFVGFNEPVDDIVISTVPLDSALGGLRASGGFTCGSQHR